MQFSTVNVEELNVFCLLMPSFISIKMKMQGKQIRALVGNSVIRRFRECFHARKWDITWDGK